MYVHIKTTTILKWILIIFAVEIFVYFAILSWIVPLRSAFYISVERAEGQTGCDSNATYTLWPATGPNTFHTVADRPIVFSSAYVDVRRAYDDAKNTSFAIRRLTVIANGLQRKFNGRVGPIYCAVFYDEGGSPAGGTFDDVPANYDVVYESRMHADEWTAHFVTCPLRNGTARPTYVSLSPSNCPSDRGRPTIKLGVTYASPAFTDATNKFALCLPPLYSYVPIDDIRLVEAVELHRLLGVDRVFVYRTATLGPSTARLIDWYASRRADYVTAVRWHVDRRVTLNYFWQHAAINDCVRRAGLEHEFVAVSDLDEVITPLSDDTWAGLLKRLSPPTAGPRDVKIGAYLFEHVLISDACCSNATANDLLTQKCVARHSVPFPEGRVRSKTLYRAEAVVKADIHAPFQLERGFEEYLVPREHGLLFHYRNRGMAVMKGREVRFEEDGRMLKFGERLRKRVNEALNEFGDYAG